MSSILEVFDSQFVVIDGRNRELLNSVEAEVLFMRPTDSAATLMPFSCGEYILRSAAMVEMTFGGLLTRLWDDPFEWTLSEELSNKTQIAEYLDVVEKTRRDGMRALAGADLSQTVPSPRTFRSLAEILIDAVSMASHFQGRAYAISQVLSSAKLPRL